MWDYTGSPGYEKRDSATYCLKHGTSYFIKVLSTSDIILSIPKANSSIASDFSNTSLNFGSTGGDDEEPPPPPGPVPAPDIKANGQDGPVTVSSGTPVSASVSLDPGSWAGRDADWWIAAHMPLGSPYEWYTYVYPNGWQPPGIFVCLQTPLFQLSTPFEVLNATLPDGNYTLYFAIDNNADGIPDATWLDSVEVKVEKETPCSWIRHRELNIDD